MSTDQTITSGCPRGVRCESCGVESDAVAVCTKDVGVGVACLTLCPRCAASAGPPPITVGTAGRLVAQHRVHLRTPRRSGFDERNGPPSATDQPSSSGPPDHP